jgi:hypothetical protein
VDSEAARDLGGRIVKRALTMESTTDSAGTDSYDLKDALACDAALGVIKSELMDEYVGSDEGEGDDVLCDKLKEAFLNDAELDQEVAHGEEAAPPKEAVPAKEEVDEESFDVPPPDVE